jgi:hypothetical protein
MINQMPKDITITKRMTRKLVIGESWAKPEWISETRRYWISCTEYGYQANQEIKESYSDKWYNKDIYAKNRYVKSLATAITRIEKLIDKDTYVGETITVTKY